MLFSLLVNICLIIFWPCCLFYNSGNLIPGKFQAPSSQLIPNEITGSPKLVKPPKKIVKDSSSSSESTNLFGLGWPGGSITIWQNYLRIMALCVGMVFKVSHVLFLICWPRWEKWKLDISTVERNLTLSKIKRKNPWFCFNIKFVVTFRTAGPTKRSEISLRRFFSKMAVKHCLHPNLLSRPMVSQKNQYILP